MPQIDFALGLLWYFVYTYSTVCHEAAQVRKILVEIMPKLF